MADSDTRKKCFKDAINNVEECAKMVIENTRGECLILILWNHRNVCMGWNYYLNKILIITCVIKIVPYINILFLSQFECFFDFLVFNFFLKLVKWHTQTHTREIQLMLIHLVIFFPLLSYKSITLVFHITTEILEVFLSIHVLLKV